MHPRSENLSIKTRLSAAVSFLIIAIAATIGYVTILYFEAETKELIGAQQFLTVSLLANEIDDKLTTAHHEVISLSKLIKPEYLQDSDAAQEFMDRYAFLNATFTNALVLLDKKGALVAETPMQSKERRGGAFGFREYFSTTLTTRKPYIGEPYLSSRHQHPVITLTAPVYDSEGEIIGVFGGSVDLLMDNVLSRLLNMKSGKTGYFYLVTHDRDLILHPDRSRILKRDIPAGSNALLERAIEGFDGTGETVTSRGLEAITSFKHLKVKDWIVAANYPKAEAYAPIYQARRTLALVLAGIILLVTAIVWYWMNSLTLPLLNFTRHVEGISEKKGEKRLLPVACRDEIGRLTDAFNRMVVELDAQQEALRESELKYRRIVATANEGIWLVDHDGRIVFVNDQMAGMLGYRVEEIVGEKVADFVPEEDMPDHLIRIENRRRGLAERYERRWRCRDGKVVWTTVSATPIFDAEQRFSGSFAMITDITEGKLAQEAIQGILHRYHTILSQLFVGILVVTEDDQIEFANQTFCGQFGILEPPSRLIELRADEIRFITSNVSADPVAALARMESIVERGERVEGEEILMRDGRVLLRDFIPITIEGKPSGRLWQHRDITERKREEGERRRLEERLVRAEKMEALGTLAGGVAHDLNNVLGIVVGYSELLLGKVGEASPAGAYVAQIQKGGERAAAIVQDLLTLTRRGVTSRQVLNLNSILMDCQQSPEFMKLSSYHPKVRLETDLEADLLNISGSFVHLGKSFMNLASNAFEAIPDGGVVTVRTRNQYLDKPISGYDEVKEGDYVVLSVADTGQGIPAVDLKRIFEPFYTKKVMGRSGTGLGLAVVWGTVKDHLGYINVVSEEGEGTTFTLYFPVTREELSPEKLSLSASDYLGHGETILVVDDVTEQRELATEMLTKLNYRVASVSSGEEAVKYLQEHSADLIVLDMIMDPGLDGLDTYRKILEVHPRQKAIIVSGFAETDRVSMAQALGAGAYVKKPYVLEKLGTAVRNELDRSVDQ